MRIRFLSLILLIIIGLGMIRISNATTTITVSIDPAKVPGRIGKYISFNIAISGIDPPLDLYAFDLNLTWTDIDFNLVGASEGPFVKQSGVTFWLTKDYTEGASQVLRLVCSRMGGGLGSTGSGVLATVTLYVLGGTTGSLFQIRDITLRNSVLDPIEPPKYDVNIVKLSSQFARARDWDLDPEFGVIDIYDMAVVAVNYGTNVVKPTKIPTSWTATAGGGWANPERLGASDDLRASSATQNQATKWGDFRFNTTTNWELVSQVEVGLERMIDATPSKNIKIELSNDNGTSWSGTTFTHTVADTAETLVWVDVTTAYSWTPTMIKSIAVKLTYDTTASGNTIRIDYLAIRVTPTPTLAPPETFDPDADVTNNRVVNIDDLVKVATNYGAYQL